MKTQKFGTPEVSLSWLLKEDSYSKEHFKTTLESDAGKKQLVDTILMLLDHDLEMRIGTDGTCLILEANEADEEYTSASYQYIDDEHVVMLEGRMPDNSIELFDSNEEYQAAIKAFIKKHPYYKQNEWGNWYDERDLLNIDKLAVEADENGND